MVGVMVCGQRRRDWYSREILRRRYPRMQPDVWRVGIGVFPRERVREVRIDEEAVVAVPDREAALPQPPHPDGTVRGPWTQRSHGSLAFQANKRIAHTP